MELSDTNIFFSAGQRIVTCMATRLKSIFTQRRQPNALCVKSTAVPGALLTTIVSARAAQQNFTVAMS